VVLAATNGVMAIHLDLLAVGLPLVLTASADLPDWLAGAAVALNATAVVLFQVPATGWTHRVGSRRAAMVAGSSLAAALVLLGGAAEVGLILGVGLLAVWVLADTLAELTQSGLEFVVSYAAAPPWAHSEYQAAYAFGRGAVRAAAPATLALAVSQGWWAWLLLALGCAVAALVHAHYAALVDRPAEVST